MSSVLPPPALPPADQHRADPAMSVPMSVPATYHLRHHASLPSNPNPHHTTPPTPPPPSPRLNKSHPIPNPLPNPTSLPSPHRLTHREPSPPKLRRHAEAPAPESQARNYPMIGQGARCGVVVGSGCQLPSPNLFLETEPPTAPTDHPSLSPPPQAHHHHSHTPLHLL